VKTVSGRKRSTFAAELGIGRRSPVPMDGRLTSTASGGSVDEPPFPFHEWRSLFVRLIFAGLGMTGMMSGADVSRSPVTFNRDVLPILVKNCQGCHSPGRIAPMPFTSYEETRPWALAIRAMVVNKKMPLRINAPHSSLFGDDGRLSQVEVDTIVTWVGDGAPEGNARDAKNSRREK
jgi:hypothetical protein